MPLEAQKGRSGTELPTLNLDARTVGWQRHAPAALYPGKRSGTQGTGVWVDLRNEETRKISCHPPGFESQTIQPLASRYTDNAVPAPFQTCYAIKMEMGIQLQNGRQNKRFK